MQPDEMKMYFHISK